MGVAAYALATALKKLGVRERNSVDIEEENDNELAIVKCLLRCSWMSCVKEGASNQHTVCPH